MLVCVGAMWLPCVQLCMMLCPVDCKRLACFRSFDMHALVWCAEGAMLFDHRFKQHPDECNLRQACK